jgi:tubby-related protein 1
VLGMKGPRKMRVIIPTVSEEGQRTVWKPMKSEEGMVARYKAGDLKNMFAFQNKAPVWNEQTKSFMLNFKNRVKEASVKNFQIVSPEDGIKIAF